MDTISIDITYIFKLSNFNQCGIPHLHFNVSGECLTHLQYLSDADLSDLTDIWYSYYSHRVKREIDKSGVMILKEIDYTTLPKDMQIQLASYAKNESRVDIMWNFKKSLHKNGWKNFLKLSKGIKND